MNEKNECGCGSGSPSFPIYDGYGIYLARVCHFCETYVVGKFRSDIFENYECDEDIDGD